MRRFIASLRAAFAGIGYAIRTQRHVRIHLTAALLVSAAAIWLELTTIEWALLLVLFALVIALEIVNTAIELTIDRIGLERHPLAKAAKDTAAGAVLIAVIFAIGVGLLLLGPPMWHQMFGK
ncbi:undecaprenol kinase/diacylglycerol kinase (ATP) [Paenibacillus cellulosilyticus]|uniref:Undecaprenol kinase/diacylglycerol kinase (ATP) n=1 Tax=Paenibacillus cellulosilyticus TaxID=375489 RepID=A0A2V2YM55_9BACL|nr:diacylglycerol kinase family protein [Paenibacillus cellulosilyticus]PWV95414.1 undecaprenol kinase/diacylglycerol kinase (ATP) [Paenibacillus cellulosilyticus]QKS43205.1 diacylglycerol kinase family protein [Paenibacillus cellulosilyticus]